jgi:5-methylcytosine-specific restriction endonuclease McrA
MSKRGHGFSGGSPRKQRYRRMLLRLDPHCQYCGLGLDMDTATLDHVIPVAQGGSSRFANMALACEPCNAHKRDTLMVMV